MKYIIIMYHCCGCDGTNKINVISVMLSAIFLLYVLVVVIIYIMILLEYSMVINIEDNNNDLIIFLCCSVRHTQI